jgi:hypothetical protein
LEEIVNILFIFFTAAIKFFLAPTTAVIAGYSFTETVIMTITGGWSGLIAFYFFGQQIRRCFMIFKKNPIVVKVTKRRRRLVRFKQRMGMWGLVILTPVLLGVPLGAILASSFFGQNIKLIILMMLSLAVWAVILTYYSIYLKASW